MEVHNFWEDAKMRVRGSGYDYEPSPIVIVRFGRLCVCLFAFFLIICFSLRKFIFFVGISYFDFRRAGNQTQKTQQQQQMWWKRQRERNRIEDDQQISANSLFRSTQKKKRVEICDFFVVNNTLQKKPNGMISDSILRFLLISFWRSWCLCDKSGYYSFHILGTSYWGIGSIYISHQNLWYKSLTHTIFHHRRPTALSFNQLGWSHSTPFFIFRLLLTYCRYKCRIEGIFRETK